MNCRTILASFGFLIVIAVGCGRIEGTAMLDIDEEAKSKVISALQAAGIDREPQAIRDVGDHWVVALPGGSSTAAAESTGYVNEAGEEESGEEGASDSERMMPSPESKPTPETATQVTVSKTGDVKLIR